MTDVKNQYNVAQTRDYRTPKVKDIPILPYTKSEAANKAANKILVGDTSPSTTPQDLR